MRHFHNPCVRRAFGYVVGLVAAVTSVIFSAPALAEDVYDSDVIDVMWAANNIIQYDVYQDYFQWKETELPQWTPDRGAFWMSSGRVGPAAIYAEHRINGGYTAYPIYGAFFSFWANRGYEYGLGYPRSIEEPATERCKRRFPQAVREQMFHDSRGYNHFLCWWPGYVVQLTSQFPEVE